jgi:rhodanese-related sulfurtransferase
MRTALPTPARVLASLLLVAGLGLGGVACGGSDGPSASSPSGSTQATAPLGVVAFAAALETPGTTVVDVRTPAEYAAGHLAGAVNIDLQGAGFADAVSRLDPSARYAVYCHSGNRSATAVSYLVGHGFAHVVELAGGIAAWQAAGRPVTTG